MKPFSYPSLDWRQLCDLVSTAVLQPTGCNMAVLPVVINKHRPNCTNNRKIIKKKKTQTYTVLRITAAVLVFCCCCENTTSDLPCTSPRCFCFLPLYIFVSLERVCLLSLTSFTRILTANIIIKVNTNGKFLSRSSWSDISHKGSTQAASANQNITSNTP